MTFKFPIDFLSSTWLLLSFFLFFPAKPLLLHTLHKSTWSAADIDDLVQEYTERLYGEYSQVGGYEEAYLASMPRTEEAQHRLQ